MANTCTNIFFCKTESEDNLKIISDFMTKTFEWEYCNEDDPRIEGDFNSKWSFPESEFEELISRLHPDDSLYMRILSHELGSEYVSYRIFKDNEWEVRL